MKIIIKGKKYKTPISIKNIRLGQESKYSVKITEKIHNDFTRFSGDDSKIHTNLIFCKKNGFKKKLGYSFLLTAILSNIYGKIFPGGNDLCLKQNCSFKNPYYVNDTLNFIIKVNQVNKMKKLLGLECKIYNQKNKLIFEGDSILLLSLRK